MEFYCSMRMSRYQGSHSLREALERRQRREGERGAESHGDCSGQGSLRHDDRVV